VCSSVDKEAHFQNSDSLRIHDQLHVSHINTCLLVVYLTRVTLEQDGWKFLVHGIQRALMRVRGFLRHFLGEREDINFARDRRTGGQADSNFKSGASLGCSCPLLFQLVQIAGHRVAPDVTCTCTEPLKRHHQIPQHQQLNNGLG
jgi:hypothetical protein